MGTIVQTKSSRTKGIGAANVKRSVVNYGAARIAVVSGEGKGSVTGGAQYKRACTTHRTSVGSAIGGSENNLTIVNDITLNTRSVSLKRASTDKGSTSVSVDSAQNKCGIAAWCQKLNGSLTADLAGIGAVLDEINHRIQRQTEIAWKAQCGAVQGSSRKNSPARIGVGTGDRDCAGTSSHTQTARSEDRSRFGEGIVVPIDISRREEIDGVAKGDR